MPNLITKEECNSTHNKLMDKIDNIYDKVEDIAIKVASLPGDLILQLDERYADKKTEVAVDRMGWLVISFVITGVLAFVFVR